MSTGPPRAAWVPAGTRAGPPPGWEAARRRACGSAAGRPAGALGTDVLTPDLLRDVGTLRVTGVPLALRQPGRQLLRLGLQLLRGRPLLLRVPGPLLGLALGRGSALLHLGALATGPGGLLVGERLLLVGARGAQLRLLQVVARLLLLARPAGVAALGHSERDERQHDQHGDDNDHDQPGVHGGPPRSGARGMPVPDHGET